MNWTASSITIYQSMQQAKECLVKEVQSDSQIKECSPRTEIKFKDRDPQKGTEEITFSFHRIRVT